MQFEKLFEDQLFFDIARHANNMATYLISKLKELNIPFSQTTTNQQFIELPTHLVDKLSQSYTFEIWQDKGTSKVIRLVTNYRTTPSDIDSLIADIKKS